MMKITEILNLKWNYQMTENLMELLFDKSKRNAVFEQYLATNPDLTQDCFLAEFQESFAERSNLKQDYTPSSICQIMAHLCPTAQSVLDVCCGTGALTIAKWSFNPNATFYLEEYSKEAVAILLFNLSVRGINAEVRNCDVLTGEIFATYKLTKNGQFSDIEKVVLDWTNLKVDCVISNPPYSLIWQPKDDVRFNGYPLPPKSKADYAFVLHGLYHLKETGTASYILPHGVLFRGNAEGKIRQLLIDNNHLDAVIGLPNKLFLATDIPVAILNFKKNRDSQNVLMMNADDLFEKAKNNNVMNETHIKTVIQAINERKFIDKLANIITPQDIKSNDYNLNLPRYVDKSEPAVIPNFLQEAKALLEITQSLDKSTQTLLQMMNGLQLNGTTQEVLEFEEAKKILAQALAPRQTKTAVIKKLQNLTPANYQDMLFDESELAELDSLMTAKKKQIEILQNMKQFFMAKMFV